MPMQRERYPENWNSIAKAVKEAANWRCQQCDRPCRKPKEDWDDFISRLHHFEQPEWTMETQEEISDDSGLSTTIDKPGRFVLTVAHLDHDTTNNEPGNLKALCPKCHLAYDAELHRKNASATRYRKLEQQGQLSFI